MRFYRPLHTIKAMTFDLDDTLYDNGPIIRRAEQALFAHISENHPEAAKLQPSDWHNIKKQLIAVQPELSSDMGQLRRLSLNAAFKQDIADVDARLKAAEAGFSCFYNARSDFVIDTHIHETLFNLAKRMPVVGITNGNMDTTRTGIRDYFNDILHSSVSRPMKPDAHMFNEAAEMLELAPKHILHVGDNLEKDVMGAINAGFQAAWFAMNRPMNLNNEDVPVLPHIQLEQFEELLTLTA